MCEIPESLLLKEADLLSALQNKPEASQSVGSPWEAGVLTGLWVTGRSSFSGLLPLNAELVLSHLERRTTQIIGSQSLEAA